MDKPTTGQREWVKLGEESFMVSIFGVGTVEIDLVEHAGVPCLDVYVHGLDSDMQQPINSIRTFFWDSKLPTEIPEGEEQSEAVN